MLIEKSDSYPQGGEESLNSCLHGGVREDGGLILGSSFCSVSFHASAAEGLIDMGEEHWVPGFPDLPASKGSEIFEIVDVAIGVEHREVLSPHVIGGNINRCQPCRVERCKGASFHLEGLVCR